MPYDTTTTAEETNTVKAHLKLPTTSSPTTSSNDDLLRDGFPLPVQPSPASLSQTREATIPMEDATTNHHEGRRNKGRGTPRQKWFDSFKADQPGRPDRLNTKFRKAIPQKPITKRITNKHVCGTKVASIDEFNGNPQNLKGFLKDARLYFQTNRETYDTDATKIAFLCSLFTQDAATWKTQIPDPVNNIPERRQYKNFVRLLRKTFKADKKKFFVPKKLQVKLQTDKVDDHDIDQEDPDGNPKETEPYAKPEPMNEKLCFKCKESGHFSRNCPKSQNLFKPSRIFLDKDKKVWKIARNVQRLDVETRDLLLQILRKDFPKKH